MEFGDILRQLRLERGLSQDQLAALLGTPKLALANSLIDAFIMRMGLAWLLAAPLGCGFIGIYAAQAAAPVPPALIGFAYLRLWARGNSPEKRLP